MCIIIWNSYWAIQNHVINLIWATPQSAFLITLLHLPSAGTSLWTESEVQGGEVHHRAIPHDKGQRLGLRRKSSFFFMTFSKSCIPLTWKGSSVASSSCISIHHCATLSLRMALPKNSMCCLIFFCSSCFSRNHNNTYADIAILIGSCAGTWTEWVQGLCGKDWQV